jgi:hypothetical protein
VLSEQPKVTDKKTKWISIVAASLFLIVLIVLIVILTKSCGSKSSSGGKVSDLTGSADTASQTSTAAAAPQTTNRTVTSSTIGSSSTQSTSKASSSTASQPLSGSILDSIFGTSSKISSDDYTPSASASSGSLSSRLTDGMTYQQVKKIIGSEGTKEFESGNKVIYKWPSKGSSGFDLRLTFKDGKLDRSSSYGL